MESRWRSLTSKDKYKITCIWYLEGKAHVEALFLDFTETWLAPEHSEVTLPGCLLIKIDSSNGRARAVAICLQNNPLLTLFTSLSNHNLRFIPFGFKCHWDTRTPFWLIFLTDRLSVILGNMTGFWYLTGFHPPSSLFHILQLGEFHALDVVWEQGIWAKSFSSYLLCSTTEDAQIQDVCDPTPYGVGQQPSPLGLLLTKNSHLIDRTHINKPLGNSERVVPVFDSLCYWVCKLVSTEVLYKFSKANFTGLYVHLVQTVTVNRAAN